MMGFADALPILRIHPSYGLWGRTNREQGDFDRLGVVNFGKLRDNSNRAALYTLLD
jgi:hypothetical protein